MDFSTQRRRAEALLQLHRPGDPVVLVNAWDVVSARLVERAGARAIATTSAGVAWALGYLDGERISRREMLDVVERIARAVSLPVTADLEAGYGPTPTHVAETVRLAIDAGAVGMNLEDSIATAAEPAADPLYSTERAVERVAAARAAASAAGIPFVLNARTDVFLRQVGDPATRLERAIERANAYRAAGADSLFVPGKLELEQIRTLAREINGPLNVLALPGGPSMRELASAGVGRISVGGGAARAALAALARGAADAYQHARLDSLVEHALPSAEINALFQADAEP
jgi:2-methylisocitrate lyase-like PEP mutase family enzyme